MLQDFLLMAPQSQANATNGNLNFSNTYSGRLQGLYAADFDSIFFNDPSRNNMKLISNSELGLVDPFNLESPISFPPRLLIFSKDGCM